MLEYFFDEICVDHETGMHLEVAEHCLKIDEMMQKKHDESYVALSQCAQQKL